MLTVIDEFTRRCLAVVMARKLRSDDVLDCLTDLFVGRRHLAQALLHNHPPHDSRTRSTGAPTPVVRPAVVALVGRSKSCSWNHKSAWRALPSSPTL